MRDADGHLWNAAHRRGRSAAARQAVLPGGRKSGLWHLLGMAQADPGAVLLVAEGYATAASFNEATGYPAAVAFDAGNLGRCAAPCASSTRPSLLVICGDDDGH